MIGTPILMFFILQLDTLTIGKLLGMTVLGGYAIAKGLAEMPLITFTSVIGRLLIPAYSTKQANLFELRNLVIKIIQSTAIIAIPLTTCLIMLSKPLLIVFYGYQYSDISVIFSLLCIYMLMRAMSVILSSIYYALGIPEVDRVFILIRAASLVIVIYPCILFWGVNGVPIALTISILIYFLMQVINSSKILPIKFSTYMLMLKNGVFASIITVLLMVGINIRFYDDYLLNIISGFIVLILSIIITNLKGLINKVSLSA